MGMKILLGVLLVINVYTFFLMYRDKQLAQKKSWRISEKRLLLSGLMFGGLGMLLGMYCFRHKTKHLIFQISVPLMCIVQIAVVIYILFLR